MCSVLYSAEIWTLSKVELNMLERVHRKILQTNQGLPTHCHSSSLTSMIGSTSVESVILQRKLNFINSTVCLDESSLPRRLPSSRILDPHANGLVSDLEATLDRFNLPSISTLLNNPVKPASWKRSITKQLGITNDNTRWYKDFTLSKAFLKVVEAFTTGLVCHHDSYWLTETAQVAAEMVTSE